MQVREAVAKQYMRALTTVAPIDQSLTRSKVAAMTRYKRALSFCLTALAALTLEVDVSKSWADENEIPFDEAKVFVELNDTDGDLGFHALIDGEAWKLLKIGDPNDVVLLEIQNVGSLRQQGLTELSFESAEPSFDELSPESFFDRFPEGEYKISGLTIDGDEMRGATDFSHVMPAPPKILSPVPADCDAPTVVENGDLTITWEAVTTSHPMIGKDDQNIVIVGYEVLIEREGPTPKTIHGIHLTPDVTEVEVPGVFLALGATYKFEVLARAESGNQTSVESCFSVE